MRRVLTLLLALLLLSACAAPTAPAQAETENFLGKVYGGSLGLMMSAMVESRRLTEDDIAELSAILERAEGELE